MRTIEQRLVELEQSTRRWKWAAIAMGAMLAGAVVLAAAPDNAVQENIATRKLQILRDDGSVAIEMALTGTRKSPMLSFFDKTGKPEIRIGDTASGDTILGVTNPDGRIMAQIRSAGTVGVFEAFDKRGHMVYQAPSNQ